MNEEKRLGIFVESHREEFHQKRAKGIFKAVNSGSLHRNNKQLKG